MGCTLDGKTVNVETEGFEEGVNTIGSGWDDWENEDYASKIKVYGVKRFWTLKCWESNVTWANSAIKHFQAKAQTGDPVNFIYSEGILVDISTQVHILDVNWRVPEGKTTRKYTLSLKEVEFQGEAVAVPGPAGAPYPSLLYVGAGTVY